MKGYIVIENFQSLKGLQIILNDINKSGNNFIFKIALKNSNDFPIKTDHISQPALVFNQNNSEISVNLLSDLIGSNEIPSKGETIFQISFPENRIFDNQPLHIYTRTKENIRGELITVKMK